MEAINLKETRSYGLGEFFEEPPEKPRETLFTFLGATQWENVEAKSNSFTLVLDRDIRQSIELSSELAIAPARKFPQQNLLLVNTYAGTEMMQRTLARGLVQAGQLLPSDFRRFFRFPQDAWFDDSVTSPFPKNLRLLDCPMSSCSPWKIEAELQLAPAPIVVLNSFEFAALSSWDRSVLTEGLLDLQRRYGLSFVVFSQEMRTDITPFLKARGPMGTLSANAHAVWKVMTPWEEDAWKKKKRSWSVEWQHRDQWAGESLH